MAVIGNYRTHAEQRKKPRRPFKYNAKIAVKIATKIAPGRDTALVECRVVDISESGARIHLARDQELPQIFTLVLTRGRGPRRFCQVLRREGTTLGVRFIEAL